MDKVYEMNRPLCGEFQIHDAFWTPRLNTLYHVTLKDTFDKLEQDGVIENYRDLADGKLGNHRGRPWHDGLLLETIRGAADYMMREPNAQLEARIDGYAKVIEAAQMASSGGYLSTYTQLDRPDMRYGMNGGSILWQHDLYNNGALFEAGVHYFAATGKKTLLQCAIRSANELSKTIGLPPKQWIVPGHSLPEYALLELIELLEDHKEIPGVLDVQPDTAAYRELVNFWIRGRGHHENRTNHPQYMGEYAQDHAPIEHQFQAVGHAVRATLYYTGVTRLAMLEGDDVLLKSSIRLWNNATQRKMHINGGIGATHFEEKFGEDYDLNNGGYLETCASAGLILWAEALSRATGNAKYFDVAELALYNLMLSSVTLKGDRYFYRNPLQSDGTDHHWLWHDCPCCPPMIAKIFGMFDRLVCAEYDDGLVINLLVGGDIQFTRFNQPIHLHVETSLPWRGTWSAQVTQAKDHFFVRVRLPQWLENPVWTHNGKIVHPSVSSGYAVFLLEAGDEIALEDSLPVRRMEAHPQVACDRESVAVMRGPLVYCAEGIDNPGGTDVQLAQDPEFKVQMHPDGFEGLGILATIQARTAQGNQLTMVPLNVWDNRAAGSMQVWLRQSGKSFQWRTADFADKLYRPYQGK